jgi:SAM-dependent methyltransferase
MHLNSELLFRAYAKSLFRDNLRVLEVGPAGIPSTYQKIVNNPTITWHTLDLEQTFGGITYVSSKEYDYPVESESYDLIISGQVIEHVRKIWQWMAELKRIVKPDGLVIIVNPVSWPYHAFPVDCWRIFPEGMKALSEEVGLELVECSYESLEAAHFAGTYTPTIPGQSYAYFDLSRRIRLIKMWNACVHFIPVVRLLKVPVEVAYDTISILKK